MSDRYSRYIPSNASIDIDYKRNSVDFRYPNRYTYKKAVLRFTLPSIYALLLLGTGVCFAYVFAYVYIPYALISWCLSVDFVSLSTMFDDVALSLAVLSFYAIFPILFCAYISIDKDRLSYFSPKIGHLISIICHMQYFKKYICSDVVDNKITIPSFTNIFLSWDTQGDFCRCLTGIKINELDLKYRYRVFLLPFIKKEIRNENRFSATFEFSSKPTNGELKVIFA